MARLPMHRAGQIGELLPHRWLPVQQRPLEHHGVTQSRWDDRALACHVLFSSVNFDFVLWLADLGRATRLDQAQVGGDDRWQRDFQGFQPAVHVTGDPGFAVGHFDLAGEGGWRQVRQRGPHPASRVGVAADGLLACLPRSAGPGCSVSTCALSSALAKAYG